MEQPPGSLDHQDLPALSIPTLIDPARKGEECVLNASSPDDLQMLKSPGCFPDSAATSPRSPSSDVTCQSGDRSQPVDAFSHTTLTLSYVSRPHRFSSPDSLSRHSPLCSMPPVSKFSLPPPSDSDKGLGETGYAPNQHYLEQAEGPVRLTTQPLSQAQVQQGNNGGVCVLEEHRELNGVSSSDGDIDMDVQEEQDCSRTQSKCKGLENGQHHSCLSSGLCSETSLDIHEGSGDSEVLFVSSNTQDHVGARDPCSLSREYRSPLEDPVSPSATSLDDVEDVFDLPQASSSPSANSCYLERAEEGACGDLDTQGAIQPGSDISDSSTRLDLNSTSKPVCRQTATEPLLDLTDDAVEDKPKTAVPHMNGNAKALKRTLKGKKLPMRSGRGMRLEAIVMNINSSRYKVSGCIRTSKKSSASQSAASDCMLISPKRNDSLPGGIQKGSATTAPSVKAAKPRAATQMKRSKTINTDHSKDSTSVPEVLHNSEISPGSTPPKSPQATVCKMSENLSDDGSFPLPSSQTSPAKSPSPPSSPQLPVQNSVQDLESPVQPEPSGEMHVARLSPSIKSPKKSQEKAKATVVKSSTAGKTKAARAPRRKQKRNRRQSSSMFSPKEPEIKLKYVNYKEEKRDSRLDSFSPFVRVERQPSPPSRCTVFNYPDEASTQHKKGPQPQAHPSGFMSATVPSTSCLQLGRVSMHSQHQRPLICSLCGQSANTMDLGDLHGPYYPEGYQPSTKTPANPLRLKADEDDYSDSDSSTCSIRRSRDRKCTVLPAPWSLRTGAQLKQRALLGSHRCNSDRTSSPAAKQARLDNGAADAEDWYSPPVLPLEPCEYWLHEDCGVWTAGVFLVKGKVYGLEEAVRAAQETMCSACGDAGATLGCFFKSCPNKYHYRCALESDCVLIEENFSMKCKKHKTISCRGCLFPLAGNHGNSGPGLS